MSDVAGPELRNQGAHGRAQAVNVLTALNWWSYWLRRLLIFPVLASPWSAPKTLRRFQFLYFGHWALIPRFPYLGPPQPREYHRFKYMLYSGNFDGGTQEYVERFMDAMPKGLELIWGGTPGWFPVMPHDIAWKDNLFLHNFPPQHFYSAYPGATINDIRNAVSLDKVLESFVEAARGAGEGGFDAAFARLVRRSAHLLGRQEGVGPEGPRPGERPRFRRRRGASIGRLARRGWRLLPVRDGIRAARELTLWAQAAFAGDRYGRHTAVTAWFPIRPGELDELAAVLNRLDQQHSPFQQLSRLHVGRLAVLTPELFDQALKGRPALVGDDAPAESSPRQLEPMGLRSNYLLLSAVFDGSRREFVRQLMAVRELEPVWERCVAYPGPTGRRDFTRWVERCRTRNAFMYSDYPDLGVAEVQGLLRNQRLFTRFLVDVAVHGWAGERLAGEFRRLADSLPALRPIGDAR